MLKAGADLSDKTLEELISLDAKEFQMGSFKTEIAQVNAIDLNDVLSRKDELESILSDAVNKKGLDLFLFVLTDILNSDSVVIAIGSETKAVEEAYNVTLENNSAPIPIHFC